MKVCVCVGVNEYNVTQQAKIGLKSKNFTLEMLVSPEQVKTAEYHAENRISVSIIVFFLRIFKNGIVQMSQCGKWWH